MTRSSLDFSLPALHGTRLHSCGQLHYINALAWLQAKSQFFSFPQRFMSAVYPAFFLKLPETLRYFWSLGNRVKSLLSIMTQAIMLLFKQLLKRFVQRFNFLWELMTEQQEASAPQHQTLTSLFVNEVKKPVPVGGSPFSWLSVCLCVSFRLL